MEDKSMTDAFTSITDKTPSSGSIGTLLVFAHECNGYVAFLMHCCIDCLTWQYNGVLPTFGVDD
jgi:hypothetical protein